MGFWYIRAVYTGRIYARGAVTRRVVVGAQRVYVCIWPFEPVKVFIGVLDGTMVLSIFEHISDVILAFRGISFQIWPL